MRPRRTVKSTDCLSLVGGNEDNALWVQFTPKLTEGVEESDPCYGMPAIHSVWEPTSAERAAIAEGANVYLTVMGTGHPPVSMTITDEELGRGPSTD